MIDRPNRTQSAQRAQRTSKALCFSLRTLRTLWLIAVFAGAVHAQSFTSAARGTTAADFLELGVGARGESLGQAYSAEADGADALYWNPAGLSQVQGGDATLMYAPYLASSYYEYAGYAQKAGPGALALGLQYFSAGSVAETDTSGASIGSVTPYDMAISLGYGLELHDMGALSGFSVGAAAKFIQSKLATTAQTEALDAGILSPAYLDGRFRLALTADNMGGTLDYDGAHENLPEAFTLGSSWRITDRWLGLLSVELPRGNGPQLGAGTEYLLTDIGGVRVAGRLGYDTISSDVTGFTGFTMGVGFDFAHMSLDYGFLPMGDLGWTQRISLSYRFGEASPAAPAPTMQAQAPPPPPAPSTWDASQSAAQADENAKDWKAAETEWKAAGASLLPEDPRTLLVEERVANAEVRQGKLAQAKQDYLSAITFAKGHAISNETLARAYVGFADCLRGNREFADARRNYEKALTISADPDLRFLIKARLEDLRNGSSGGSQ